MVKPSQPFDVVYALYHHEYLGHLIEPYVVQRLPNGVLSMSYQRLTPENIKHFSPSADETDAKLVALAAEIMPKAIVKRFGGDPRQEAEFFTKKFRTQEGVQKYASDFIQKRMAQMLTQMADRQVYEMGNDGYPAKHKVRMIPEKATAEFHLTRTDRVTHYYPVVYLKGKKMNLIHNADILCYNPVWMLCGNELFNFEDHIEGKKLKPFLTKNVISVPIDKEEEYYSKFVSQLIERYEVKSENFDVLEVREEPDFYVRVRDHDGKSFAFDREVRYGKFTFPLTETGHHVRAILDRNDDGFFFHKVHRDAPREKAVTAFLDTISPNPGSFIAWENVPRDLGLSWLSTKANRLDEQGIRLIQEGIKPTTTEKQKGKIHLEVPELHLTTSEAGDWFDIRAVVKIGGFEIPFTKFKHYILRGKREYPLPDGSIAILPETWFLDYRHVMEVSEMDEENGLVRLRNYQAPLLPLTEEEQPKLRDLSDIGDIPPVEPPVGLKATLRDYQLRGLSWLVAMRQHNMGCILADDMGLGKTLQTISLLLLEKENGAKQPSLAVLPTSLIHNWRNEAAKFAPALKVLIHTGQNRTRSAALFATYDLVLTTYGIVRQDLEMLKTFPFHYVILDEAQNIKNPSSQASQAVRKLVCKHRLAITGTPVENGVLDLWSQMTFLNPGLLGSEGFFKSFYAKPIEQEGDTKMSAKLREIIYPYLLRRKKEQVETQLPPKIENLHYCEMEESQSELYDRTRSAYRNYLMQIFGDGTWKSNKLDILAGLQKLRQIAIHPKMMDAEYDLMGSGKYKQVSYMLKTVLEEGKKVLIFSQYVRMLDILRRDLDSQGVKYCYLDGGTRDRQEQVEIFQKDETIPVFLISLKAGGVGLTLTAAEYVFILDPWWNPAAEMQAIDRAHRIGQTKTVMYYKFISVGTIEEKILALQQKKARLSDDLISADEDFFGTLTQEEMVGMVE